MKINFCVYGVPPAPVYKGVEEGEGRPSLWRALLGPAGLPLAPLYTGAGAPQDTQVDQLIF